MHLGRFIHVKERLSHCTLFCGTWFGWTTRRGGQAMARQKGGKILISRLVHFVVFDDRFGVHEIVSN